MLRARSGKKSKLGSDFIKGRSLIGIQVEASLQEEEKSEIKFLSSFFLFHASPLLYPMIDPPLHVQVSVEMSYDRKSPRKLMSFHQFSSVSSNRKEHTVGSSSTIASTTSKHPK